MRMGSRKKNWSGMDRSAPSNVAAGARVPHLRAYGYIQRGKKNNADRQGQHDFEERKAVAAGRDA
jgi:hypothetical protein